MRQPIPLRTIQQKHTDLGDGRDTSRPVMLVGFQHQGNLGLGYLTSVLRQRGYDVCVVDIEQDPEEIVRAAQRLNPVLIGFSLIFQFYVGGYGSLVRALRAAGSTATSRWAGTFPA
jgi:methylmalonyl-CoA mutase cobalamin-binding subunit